MFESIASSVSDMEADITRIKDEIRELRSLAESLNGIGGTLPRYISSAMPKTAVDPEMTDSGFLKTLRKALDGADLLTAMVSYVSLMRAQVLAAERVQNQIYKLEKRAAAGEAGGTTAETEAASTLTVAKKETLAVYRKRMVIALERFFETRKKVLAFVAGQTSELSEIWPEGSVDLRSSALKHSAADDIQTLALTEQVITRGEKKVGEKCVKI